ncbi:hypothetical protein GIB67_024359 [Kingdonia uniflora]|uniref:Bet v I/Major latex protein domain-containing protein n=1 Tax=Kingdonia uniflora TaxID=39325 RepID=A0A7J7LF70_9MAGN|nr:hypothetical protein GIB67_024359 [Kingdonia uniflora]
MSYYFERVKVNVLVLEFSLFKIRKTSTTKPSHNLSLFLSIINSLIPFYSIETIMGIIKMSQNFTTRVAPVRLFNALIIDWLNLCPKLMFSTIESIENLEGNGEAGSIVQINFTDACPMKFVKHHINELDKENLRCKFTVIEGEILGDKLESIIYEVKIGPHGSGCILKISSEYHPHDGIEIKEEDIDAGGKDLAVGICEVVEAYLMAHPKFYL